jgi:predicted nucleic acid-binding protein
MVFVDTGAWFALSVASDADHVAAKLFIEQNLELLITTD